MKDHLWLYSHDRAYRFLLRNRWADLFNRIVNTGWEMPSANDMGWLLSALNPHPEGTLFTAEDARSFALAVESLFSDDTMPGERFSKAMVTNIVRLFSRGPVLIRSQSPRKTTGAGMVEGVYGYSCRVCGFLHSSAWLFSTERQSPEEIRASMESMLQYTYCPLCGSKDVRTIHMLLPPFDPERARDFMLWEEGAC